MKQRIYLRDLRGRFAKADARKNLKIWYGSNLIASGKGVSKKIRGYILEDIEDYIIQRKSYRYLDIKTGKYLKKFDGRKNIVIEKYEDGKLISERKILRNTISKEKILKQYKDTFDFTATYSIGIKELCDRFLENVKLSSFKQGELSIRIRSSDFEDIKIHTFYYNSIQDDDGKTLLWNIRDILNIHGLSNYTGELRGKGKEKFDFISVQEIDFNFKQV